MEYLSIKQTAENMKSVNKPKYGSKTILTDACQEQVSLFLKRQSIAGASDALFYWEQAPSSYLASKALPDSACLLTSYYCIFKCGKSIVTLQMKKRFNWDIHKPIEERKKLLNKYHEKVRSCLFDIYGESNIIW